MFQTNKYIKNIKENRQKIHEFVKEKYIDEDGFATFDIYVDRTDCVSNISVKGSELISHNLIEQIEDYTDPIPYIYPIKIRLHSIDDVSDIKEKIHDYYKFQVLSSKQKLRLNLVKGILLTVLGTIFLTLFFILENILENPIYTELLSIAGTFSIWEAVNSFLLERNSLNINLANKIQLEIAEVEIVKEKTRNN